MQTWRLTNSGMEAELITAVLTQILIIIEIIITIRLSGVILILMVGLPCNPRYAKMTPGTHTQHEDKHAGSSLTHAAGMVGGL